jgi:methyltransferase (TIGR00027 family)
MTQLLISDVSDTARWVAAYRAFETLRPDPLFKDPFAANISGEFGLQIARSTRREMRNGWPMIIRTKLVDDLILQSIAGGCDCVLNLGAGFDTRPYRLVLPSTLAWYEADLPQIIGEKETALASEKPQCIVNRTKVDLRDSNARRMFLRESLVGSRRALVLTEGLLAYFDNYEVESLAVDLAEFQALHWWIVDLASPAAIRKMMIKGMNRKLTNAPLKFAPPNGVAFFENLGWKTDDIRSVFRSAVHFRRVSFFMRALAVFPDPNPRRLGKRVWGAVIRFENIARSSQAPHA